LEIPRHRFLLANLSFVSLSLVAACSTDATPKTKPVAAPVVVKQTIVRAPPPEEPLPPMTAAPAFSAVVAGSGHSCGVTGSGDLYCWGSNDLGQLGDSGTTERTLPSEVGGGLKWRTVSVGGSHSCGITTDGAAYCWGSSIAGQLGSDTLGTLPTPFRMPQAPPFVKIASGNDHTCAITTDGKMFCWGENLHGELGASVFSRFSPVVQVAPQLTWARVSAGPHSTCGITIDGKLYCWGLDDEGGIGVEAGDACQLDGEPEQCSLPLRQPADSLRFTTVAAGVTHSCAITGDGVLYCWGANDHGQLGSGFRDPLGPTAVVTQEHWIAVSAGRGFTCAITTAGVAECWGADDDGQLAGRAADATVPEPVAGSVRFTAISSGTAHTCALSTHHLVYCWGANGNGQLGTGSHKRSFEPEKLMFAAESHP
jgi:alpha-tubulin suppressor-like RCC1 family protein